MPTKITATSRYDVSEHLQTPEEMAAYLEACLEQAGSDAAFIAKALGDIARAKGMAQVARATGLSRESLYKSLSGGGASPDVRYHFEGGCCARAGVACRSGALVKIIGI